MVYVKRATLGSGNAFLIWSLSTPLYMLFFFATEKTASGAITPLFFVPVPPHLITIVLNFG